MLKKSLALVGLTFSLSANAATLNTYSGSLIGASDVEVNGGLYDVSFSNGTCDGLFDACTQFTFTDAASATVASEALLEQVFIGFYDYRPNLTSGIALLTGTAYTHYTESGGQVYVSGAFNNSGDNIDYVIGDVFATSYSPSLEEVYAVWSPVSQVPVPAAVYLFGSALLSLFGLKRNQNKRTMNHEP